MTLTFNFKIVTHIKPIHKLISPAGNTKVDASCPLTYDVEPEGLWNLRFGWHLTLVRAGVPGLWRGNPQRPLVAALGVQRLEALVVGVGEYSYGQDVQVTLSDPWNLRTGRKNKAVDRKTWILVAQVVTYRTVAKVPHPAVQQGRLANGGSHIPLGAIVEVRLGVRLLPVRLHLAANQICHCKSEQSRKVQLLWV